jgi:hypothetical protein
MRWVDGIGEGRGDARECFWRRFRVLRVPYVLFAGGGLRWRDAVPAMRYRCGGYLGSWWN